MELLSVFEQVCKKHNLTYYLTFGSLLGAIRHNGFVPWDDDIDLFMMREDFDKLYNLGHEISSPYFLQTPYTDPTFFITTIRLRNSKTSYIPGPFKYQGFNHGINISVAPLDYLPDNYEEVFACVHKLIMDNGTYMRCTNPFLDENDKERVRNYKGGDPLKTYETIHEIARQSKPSEKICSLVIQS